MQLNGQCQPEVRVSTNCQKEEAVIKMRENGSGIPEKVKNEIFQPFFTTILAGHGTGLGLSLSYDIINKGHGRELKVDLKVGGYAQLVIRLLKSQQFK